MYHGEWDQDIIHGEGTYTHFEGARYSGHFKNGMKDGKGVLEALGNVYEGTFVKNKAHGHGMIKWKDGRKYKGEWQESQMHGQGVYSWPNGKQYKG